MVTYIYYHPKRNKLFFVRRTERKPYVFELEHMVSHEDKLALPCFVKSYVQSLDKNLIQIGKF